MTHFCFVWDVSINQSINECIVCCAASGLAQCVPMRSLQSGVRPFDSSQDKQHPDAIARLLASGVAADHRLPNVPAQLAKTVDEIECAAPPPAN